ncbi:MAG: sigma-70 family RNA polymerase sigma factor [Patescibacteria group bacterium]|nr:sigma-70 family RNA polymerase sigma factor [Patescibacteria group bacterium]
MAGKPKEAEFLKAYEAYADAIFRRCFFKTSDRELAKDLTQQTFLRAWTYWREGRDIENERALLYRIANNLIIDWYRQRKSESLDDLLEKGFDPVAERESTEDKAEISWALQNLSRLKEEDQELITLRFVEDMSPKDIAALKGEKENNISVRIHRALGRLRKLIT